MKKKTKKRLRQNLNIGVFLIKVLVILPVKSIYISIKYIFNTLFPSKLMRQVKARKRERKLELKEIKKVWVIRKNVTIDLYRTLVGKTRGVLQVNLLDNKFKPNLLLKGQGYTRISIKGKFGILYCAPNLKTEKITIFSSLNDFSLQGEELTIDNFIEKISAYC